MGGFFDVKSPDAADSLRKADGTSITDIELENILRQRAAVESGTPVRGRRRNTSQQANEDAEGADVDGEADDEDADEPGTSGVQGM